MMKTNTVKSMITITIMMTTTIMMMMATLTKYGYSSRKTSPTPHGHGLWRFLITVMSEIMKIAMTESMIMMIEHVCFDNHCVGIRC